MDAYFNYQLVLQDSSLRKLDILKRGTNEKQPHLWQAIHN